MFQVLAGPTEEEAAQDTTRPQESEHGPRDARGIGRVYIMRALRTCLVGKTRNGCIHEKVHFPQMDHRWTSAGPTPRFATLHWKREPHRKEVDDKSQWGVGAESGSRRPICIPKMGPGSTSPDPSPQARFVAVANGVAPLKFLFFWFRNGAVSELDRTIVTTNHCQILSEIPDTLRDCMTLMKPFGCEALACVAGIDTRWSIPFGRFVPFGVLGI